MAIKWGSTFVTAVKWGSTTCTQVKWGNTIVWPDSEGYNGSSFAWPIASGFNNGVSHYVDLGATTTTSYNWVITSNNDNIDFSKYNTIVITTTYTNGYKGSKYYRAYLESSGALKKGDPYYKEKNMIVSETGNTSTTCTATATITVNSYAKKITEGHFVLHYNFNCDTGMGQITRCTATINSIKFYS